MDSLTLLRRQARALEEMAHRFKSGLLTAGIEESFRLAQDLETIRGEILDAVIELEHERDG